MRTEALRSRWGRTSEGDEALALSTSSCEQTGESWNEGSARWRRLSEASRRCTRTQRARARGNDSGCGERGAREVPRAGPYIQSGAAFEQPLRASAQRPQRRLRRPDADLTDAKD